MRPTGRKWLGHEKQHCVNSVSERIARRCGMPVFYSLLKDSERSRTRRCLSLSNMSRLVLRSQDDEGGRDVRTQPGVLIPGSDSKNNPPQRGGRVDAARADLPPEGDFRTTIYRHFPPSSLIPERRRTGRARLNVDVSPGLKPRAQSCNPFGIKTFSYRSAGLSLIELLVVLTIIAAISALITTSVLSALKQQNQRICLINMLTIEAAKDEYIRDHPGATSISDSPSFQQYFKFGIPRCPDGGTYENLLSLTQPVNCSIHGSVSPTPTP